MLRACLVVLAFATPCLALAAEVVYPPGSRIGLVPPANMKLSRGIAGFQDSATGAAIVAIEMPADAYPTLSAGFTDDALKTQGFTSRTRETVHVGKSDALLVSGDQHEPTRTVPKSVLIAADPGMTILVIGQLPPGAPAEMEEQVRAALRTVAIRAPLSMAEQIAVLPFGIGDFADFRPLRAMAGNSIMLTDGPNDSIREADQPVIIIATSFSPPPPPEQRPALAQSLLVANAFIRDPVFERSQSFRQDGADWHEIVAKGLDVASGRPVIVAQTIRFSPDSYLRTVGVARVENRDAVLPRFRRVVDSLTLK